MGALFVANTMFESQIETYVTAFYCYLSLASCVVELLELGIF